MWMIQHTGLENLSVQPDNIPLIGVVIPTDIVMFDRLIKSESAIPTAGPDRGTSASPAMAALRGISPQSHQPKLSSSSPESFAKIILGPPARKDARIRDYLTSDATRIFWMASGCFGGAPGFGSTNSMP